MKRCLNCGRRVENPVQTDQRVGDEAVTLDACGECYSVRLIDDAARTGAVVTYPTEAAR